MSEYVASTSDPGGALRHLVCVLERTVIGKLLESGISQRELARKLSLSRSTLRKKISELDLG